MNRLNELFVDVVLPLPLQKLYTYAVPAELQDKVIKGGRVVVQFGKHKLYTALVFSVHNQKPPSYTAKEILEVIDEIPVVTEMQFGIWEWISEYYLCTLGEVMNAALPSVMKLQSEMVVVLEPEFDDENKIITEEEQVILNKLKDAPVISISDVSKISGITNGIKLVRSMVEKGWLMLQEEMKNPFHQKLVTYVRMSKQAEDESFMHETFSSLEKKAPKQLDLLMTFMKLKAEKNRPFFPKQILLKSSGTSAANLTQLVKKGVLEVFEGEDSLAYSFHVPGTPGVVLNESQELAYEQIGDHFKDKKVTLLHGVTSSGKTEVYIRLIHDAIDSGKQVLYLLPEIALTTQIIGRLKNHFGEKMLVYHSRFSNRERAEVYMKVLKDGADGKFKFPIVIGARSSVFLPFSKPGLLIVDEEHESSFKQNDPAPRYNARDTAVVLGFISGSNVLLGSATPSMESFYNAEVGKYALVRMNERFGGMNFPAVKILDLKDAYKKQQMKSHFSNTLLENIKQVLEKKEQVILFQNRRGFAPVLECKNCGWIPHCVNCDVSLTYHKKSNHLRCHYCGYTTPLPSKCQACGDTDVRMKGMGTERIEDEISIFFPDASIQRLDLDTTSSRQAFQRIISGFENGEIDILVGTQMITKGLDFDRVSLVGVINADHLINFPDFRSAERSYQLLAQVAGRAGRKLKHGKVLVQTFQTGHPLLQFLIQNDYSGFYNYELDERKKYNYPPFVRLIEIRLKMRDEKDLERLSILFTKELKAAFGNRVLGPVIPAISRIRNLYLRNLMLKLEKSLPDHKVKHMISRVTDRFLSFPEHRGMIIQIDVDPF